MRKKFEYHTTECKPEELFEILNDEGAKGWEFVLLLTKQMMYENKLSISNDTPKVLTLYVLIFKREKNYEG